MKKKTMCILAAAAALTGAQPAQAGDKDCYFFGGLFSGWILNEVFDTSVHTHVRYTSPVTVRSYSHCRSYPIVRYEYRPSRVWVSGHHTRMRSHCGRIETRRGPGRYEGRTKRSRGSYERSPSRKGHGGRSGRH